MSDSKTQAGRLAILSGIADIAKAAVADQRQLAADVMEPGEAHALRHPVTGEKLARVRMSDPNPTAVVVDRDAVEAWIRANDPSKVQVRQQIAEGREAEVLAVLAKHAPGLVDLVSSVPAYAVEEIVKLSTKAGRVVGPGGELDIPGIEMRTSQGSVSVGEKADDWLDQLRDLVLAGRVGIDGSVRQLEAGAGGFTAAARSGESVTRAFTHDELEELQLNWSSSGAPIVACEAYDKRRWYTIMRIVFEHDGALWQIERMDPNSEIQEGQDRWSSDPVIATLVGPYEASITKYAPVSA